MRHSPISTRNDRHGPATWDLAFRAAVLIVCLVAMSPNAVAAGAELEPIGYLVADQVRGGLGTKGGQISPSEAGQSILVVVTRVDPAVFIPTETEYAAIELESPNPETLEPRESMRIFDATRFRIFQADGRALCRGHLIAHWEVFMGFTEGSFRMVSSTISLEGEKQHAAPPADTLAIACLVDPEDATPPLRIQLDRGPAAQVPATVLEMPKYPF